MLPISASLVALVNVLVAQADDYNVMMDIKGPFQPTQSNVVGYVDVLDEMHIEMDVLIHSFPSGWASVFHCTPSGNYPRVPGIWLHPSSDDGMGFHLKFSNNAGDNYGADTGGNFVAGQTYHTEIDITQGTHKVTINGEVVIDEVVQDHATYENVICYASDPWYTAADVTLSNIIIANMDKVPTEEPSSEPTKEPTTSPTAEPTTEPSTAPTHEPTQDPVRDCSALHIDEYLQDCSSEFDGHSVDIAILQGNVSTLDGAIDTLDATISSHGAAFLALEESVDELMNTTATADAAIVQINAELQSIMEQLDKLGDYPASASSVGVGNLGWFEQTAGGSTTVWSAKDLTIGVLVLVNLVTIAILAVVCFKGSAGKVQYGAVTFASDSELANMK